MLMPPGPAPITTMRQSRRCGVFAPVPCVVRPVHGRQGIRRPIPSSSAAALTGRRRSRACARVVVLLDPFDPAVGEHEEHVVVVVVARPFVSVARLSASAATRSSSTVVACSTNSMPPSSNRGFGSMMMRRISSTVRPGPLPPDQSASGTKSPHISSKRRSFISAYRRSTTARFASSSGVHRVDGAAIDRREDSSRRVARRIGAVLRARPPGR